jgi:polysaccharide deacetylase 2 family uncharacterized protein YibQ
MKRLVASSNGRSQKTSPKTNVNQKKKSSASKSTNPKSSSSKKSAKGKSQTQKSTPKKAVQGKSSAKKTASKKTTKRTNTKTKKKGQGFENVLRSGLFITIGILIIALVGLVIIGPAIPDPAEGTWSLDDPEVTNDSEVPGQNNDSGGQTPIENQDFQEVGTNDSNLGPSITEEELEQLREVYPEEELRKPDEFSLLPTALQDVFFGFEKPQLIIVIDDAGTSLRKLEPFLQIPFPITVAVLPQLSYSAESAEAAHSRGHEVIAHMPMEARSGQYPGPGTIYQSMNREEVLDLLEKNLSTIPHYVGLNNHMGSAVTADSKIMQIVLEFSRDKDYIFLDSRTSAQSVARELAESLDYSILERDVFLDNETNRESMLKALEQGKEIAKSRGYAVMIGHIWTEELAEILIEQYPVLLEEGYDFNTLSSIIMQGDQ